MENFADLLARATAFNNQGIALLNQGQAARAEVCFRQALACNPVLANAYNNLGNALYAQARADEALGCYREALRINPDHADAYHNLGADAAQRGQWDDAVANFRQALRCNPDHADAYNNLGLVLKDQGLLDEAIACFQSACRLQPQRHPHHSALLGTLHYHPDFDAYTILSEHRRWEQVNVLPRTPRVFPFPNDRSPERRLRVGYVSADFRDHVAGRYFWPLLKNHDRERFEIALYSNYPGADATTARFQNAAHRWRWICGLSDEQVAAGIRHDEIDILVDLSQHMAGNRLLVFAHKPAPVQVSFHGYPGTSGLSAINHRLTDPYLDPPGEHDEWYAERTYRLPSSFWCFEPEGETPAVDSLPALSRGFITFGCLNNLCKINDQVLALWSRVLGSVPNSRLMLLANAGSQRQRLVDCLAGHGVAPARVEFVSFQPRHAYLAYYNQMDIGLDTLPYNGHTTSLDSFWMGVPVVTLVGQTVVGRAGLSQLTNLGLPELVALNADAFVDIAVSLATDLASLQALRGDLRGRMQRSPLMDGAAFARGIEAAYRDIWRKWCANQEF